MINLKSVPIPDSNYVVRDIGEETILISKKENLIHTLEGVGALIWKNIDGQKSLGFILESICSEFDVDKQDAEDDLFGFIKELEKTGLIKVR